MRLLQLRGNHLATLTLVVIASVLLLAQAGGRSAAGLRLRAPAASWQGLVGGPRPQVALGQRMVVVLRSPSLATRIRHAGTAAAAVDQRRWTSAAYASQRRLLSRLAASGVQVRPEYRYARVLNGFSAPIDGRALSLLDADRDVAAVYPVRAAYPAGDVTSTAPDSGLSDWHGAILPGFDGAGVTIALLDTGIDLSHPWLEGRLASEGVDLVDGSRSAEARSRPGDPSEIEEHGTEIASLLVGSGPAVEGIAPGARVLPIRVAGWQRDANQEWTVFGRTDQVLAGFERAVDPNDDRDAADASRIILVPLAEPFAAFPDEPLARAAAGAALLGTLVVTPAGNDGPAAAVFGSISSPGSAPSALTVGAADLRPQAREARVVLQTGLVVLLDRALPLAGLAGPARRLQLELAVAGGEPGSTLELDDFFDTRGYSRVAGHAALISGTGSVELAVKRAVRAGARAVFLYGSGAPPGALGTGVSVPVVGLPAEVGPAVAEAVRGGARIFVTIGRTRTARNASAGRVAPFSSRGLAFDGRLKPEVVAPGVGLIAAGPGFAEDGSPRAVTVNGSSAAAALVAGAAARLAHGRPELDAEALKSLLVGAARPVQDDPIAAQGGGLLDLGAAAAHEVISRPAALSLGPIARTGTIDGLLTLRSVSTRRLTLYVSTGSRSRRRAATLSVSPARIELPAGESVDVRVRAVVRRLPVRLGTLQGAVLVTPVGGAQIRIPWMIGMRPRRLALLANLNISARRFWPSDTSPAVLAFQAGRVLRGKSGSSVQPVSRLDIELWDETGRRSSRLGLLARLRDLLPGRYAFGLTGRDPQGRVLPPGRYRLRLVAFPTVRGPATRRSVDFTIQGTRPKA